MAQMGCWEVFNREPRKWSSSDNLNLHSFLWAAGSRGDRESCIPSPFTWLHGSLVGPLPFRAIQVVDDEMVIVRHGKDIDQLLAAARVGYGRWVGHLSGTTRRQTLVGPKPIRTIPAACPAIVDDEVAIVFLAKDIDLLLAAARVGYG